LPHQVQGRCAAATLHALNQSKEVQALPDAELEADHRRHCIAAHPEERHPATAGAILPIVVDARLVQNRDLLVLHKLRLIFLFGYWEAAQALKVLVVLIVGCILGIRMQVFAHILVTAQHAAAAVPCESRPRKPCAQLLRHFFAIDGEAAACPNLRRLQVWGVRARAKAVAEGLSNPYHWSSRLSHSGDALPELYEQVATTRGPVFPTSW